MKDEIDTSFIYLFEIFVLCLKLLVVKLTSLFSASIIILIGFYSYNDQIGNGWLNVMYIITQLMVHTVCASHLELNR